MAMDRSRHYLGALSESRAHGERDDCTVMALTVATGASYSQVHRLLADYGRQHGRRFPLETVLRAAAGDLGYRLATERMSFPAGARTMKTIGRALNAGTWLAFVRGHVAAVVDGRVYDWTDGRRHRVTHAIELRPTDNPPAAWTGMATQRELF